MSAESYTPSDADLLRLVPRPLPPGVALLWRELNGGPVVSAEVGRVHCLLTIDEVEGREWYHVSASVPGDPLPRKERRALSRKYKAPISSTKPALPTWEELRAVRKALFQPDAVVVQVFPPEAEWFSISDVLHLWQRLGEDRLIPDLRRKGGGL